MPCIRSIHTIKTLRSLETLLRPYQQHKLDFRSDKCIYLGISPTHKRHKCVDKSGRIYVSKDVTFSEVEFPYPLLQRESSLPTSSTQHTNYTPLQIISNSHLPSPNWSHQVKSDEMVPKTPIRGENSQHDSSMLSAPNPIIQDESSNVDVPNTNLHT